MKQYEQIVIVGFSQLSEKCAEIAARSALGIETLLFNTRGARVPKEVEALANLKYFCLGKAEIMEYLRGTGKRTLVFSIMNNYLFPAEVIKNPVLRLINLHHALLPKHPGRNAEVWTIFEGDEAAGITWHMITAGVDEGDIIQQREIAITEHMTSLTLLRALNVIALESFPEILRAALREESMKTIPQLSDGQYPLRYAKERPSDGVLDLGWDIDKMYRFVRAMDYGVLKIMGDPVVLLDGKKYTWKKYAFSSDSDAPSDEIEVFPGEIHIKKDGKELRLLRTRQMEDA